ncbi:MAG: hypothetical protein CMD10_03665 [Flavobacteriales bacterium]|nr:hypothetical protein [Flavobacteriales bacterium]
MSEKEKNKRREFLNHVCPAVAMAFLGVPAIQSCSSGDDDVDTGNGNNNGGNTGGTDVGYTKSGNTITIDLNHSSFSNLQSQGWIQFTAEKMLILKLSSSSYKAFDGRCPHAGTHTAWSYNSSNNRFRCGQHGNSYDTDCVTPGNGGVLTCYNTSLSGSSLVVTTS